MDLGFSSVDGGQDLLFSAALRLVEVPAQSAELFMGVKCLGCAADHLPLPNAKFKNVWNYLYCPPHAIMLCCIITTGTTL
jgi:hypothetical protein